MGDPGPEMGLGWDGRQCHGAFSLELEMSGYVYNKVRACSAKYYGDYHLLCTVIRELLNMHTYAEGPKNPQCVGIISNLYTTVVHYIVSLQVKEGIGVFATGVTWTAGTASAAAAP